MDNDVKAFLEKIKTDDTFRQDLANAKDKDERLDVVKKAGFNFTQDDITSLKAMLFDQQQTAAPATSWSCWIDGHCGRTCENDVICSSEVLQTVTVTVAQTVIEA